MKPDKLKFIDNSLERAFNDLKDNDPLKKALIRALKDIRQNCYCGRNVRKKLIPKKLIEKYGINNLWIYNVPSAWRLIYSLTTFIDLPVISFIAFSSRFFLNKFFT